MAALQDNIDPSDTDAAEARRGILPLHDFRLACGSLLAERIQGRTLTEAAQFQHDELVETLEVPPAKLHCAVLAETALKAALRAWAAPRTPIEVTTQTHQSHTCS